MSSPVRKADWCRVARVSTIEQMQLDRLRRLRGLKVSAATLTEYDEDPVGFVTEAVGDFIWSKQTEVLEAVRDHSRVAVRSCHSAGKSFIAARVAAWWIAAHPMHSAFVVTTAPTFSQVRAILWREIGRAYRAGKLPGRINQTEWWMGEEQVAFGRKPADWNPDAFQGIHAEYVLVIIDEASGVPATIFTAAETLASNEAARILVIGNPDDPTSEFAKVSQPGSGWHTIRIDGFETPNFTTEKVPDKLGRLLLDPAWVEDKRRRWGEDNPLYISKVRGEFPEDSEDALIAPSWIRKAVARSVMPDAGDPSALGVDVARFGSAETVIYRRHGGRARLHWSGGKTSTTKTTGQVTKAMRETGSQVAQIDGVGVGGGVVDACRENGLEVGDLNGGSAPIDRERFFNARAEWYWNLRDLFRDDEIDIEDDEELHAQLVSLRWSVNSRGRIVVESKSDMEKRGVESPDRADALSYAFAPHDQNQWGAY